MARARAILSSGSGYVSVNGKSLESVQPHYLKMKMMEPLIIAGKDAEKVNIKIRVNGGGSNGQAEAVRLVIARALADHKAALKEKFLQYDRNLLVADVRAKETRKPNTQGKARSKRQKSYR
mgnify:CR=1 FL=1